MNYRTLKSRFAGQFAFHYSLLHMYTQIFELGQKLLLKSGQKTIRKIQEPFAKQMFGFVCGMNCSACGQRLTVRLRFALLLINDLFGFSAMFIYLIFFLAFSFCRDRLPRFRAASEQIVGENARNFRQRQSGRQGGNSVERT